MSENDSGELLDDDGYPTDETLARIRTWPCGDFDGLMAFINSIWWQKYGWKEARGYVHMSTGGWSGNEDIISALRENRVFWAMFWYSNKRGGHYIFKKR